ncbi:MAG: hypothetical protein WBC60_05540 [Cognaticolwellia sp.]
MEQPFSALASCFALPSPSMVSSSINAPFLTLLNYAFLGGLGIAIGSVSVMTFSPMPTPAPF